LSWHGKAATLTACADPKDDSKAIAVEAPKNGRFLSHFFACPKTVPARYELLIRVTPWFYALYETCRRGAPNKHRLAVISP
jgi:hypothetical protein